MRIKAGALALACLLLAACAGPGLRGPSQGGPQVSGGQGRPDDSLEILRDGAQRRPDDPVPIEALAGAYARRGWMASAAQAWEKALAAPGRGSGSGAARKRATEALFKFYLARGAEAGDESLWAEAAADDGRAAELEPGNTVVWPGLAVAARRAGDKKTAFQAYARWVALKGGDANLLMAYACAAHAAGALDAALDACRRVAVLQPGDPRSWNNEGTVLVEMGRYGEGEACFEKALALRPDMVQALNGKASACYYQKRPQEARVLWGQVLDLAPDDPVATRNLRTLVKMGL